MKKLGFGLMRLPSLDTAKSSNVDMEQLKKMVDLFMERGFTYFDTAWMYCGLEHVSDSCDIFFTPGIFRTMCFLYAERIARSSLRVWRS